MDHILVAQDFTNGSVAQNHRLYLEEKAVKEALDTPAENLSVFQGKMEITAIG